MTSRYSLADVAALIGEPTRAAMLLALFDGEALSASELARAADLSAPATSLHLAKLAPAGLVAVRKEGRHRYYRLANRDVAYALKALGLIATAPPKPRALTAQQTACGADLLRPPRRRHSRCARRGVREEAAAHHRRRRHLPGHGAGRALVRGAPRDRRRRARTRSPLLARRCLDWTERRPHLAGALGAAVLERFLERRWATRAKGSRAVRLEEGYVERLDLSR